MPLKAVIFDLGDTLWPLQYETEIWPLVRQQMVEDFSRIRGVAPEEAGDAVDGLRRALGRILADTFLGDTTYDQLHLHHYIERALALVELQDDALTEAVCHAFFMAEHRHEKVQADDETLGLLRGIKDLQIDIGLVSNTFSPGHFHQLALQRCGAARYIDAPVYSTDLGCRKPDQRIYKHCLSLLAVPPQETLFVGDRLKEDVRGPQSLGIRTVLYQRYRQEEPTPEIVPDFIHATPGEVLQTVRGLVGAPP